jgi:glucokinase-like ROK family protein
MNDFHWENSYNEELTGLKRKKFIQKIKIVKYLYVHGPNTNADICKHLKISVPKSFSLLNELIDSNLIEKQGRGLSIGGRRPDLYGIKEKSLFVLAIDMNRYKTRMSIFDNHNTNITGIETYPLILDNNIATIDKLVEYANKLIVDSGIDPGRLMGIGISMPGLIDARKGINYTYFNFGKTTVREILEKRFNRPVFIENDAKATALAEFRFGLAKDKKNVLVIYLDWGIGLGLILNGKLYRGSSGFAGEFSHIPMVEQGLLCHCGKQGCIETIASGTAIVRLAKEGIESGKSSLMHALTDLDQINVKSIVDAAFRGDQHAINILSDVGINLGKGLAILIQLFNPELIILGGQVSEADQYIITPIQQSLNIYCMQQIRQDTKIKISEMRQSAGIMGAIAIVMEDIFENHIKKS